MRGRFGPRVRSFATPQHARDASLDGLRAVAIAMVIAMHTGGYVALPDGPATDALRLAVDTIAVPVFFLVDGVLFARAQRAGRPFDATAYRRRSARRLLLPWFAFSSLYLSLRWLYESLGSPPDTILVGRGALAWLEALALGLASSQLYFLPSLYAIRLLAPWTRRLALRSTKVRALAFATVAILTGGFLLDAYRARLPLPGYDPVLHALWGLPFYLLGVASAQLRLRGIAPVALSFAAFVAARVWLPGLFWATQYAYLALAFAAFTSLPLTPAWLAAVGRRTMGIYLLHQPLVLFLAVKIIGALVATPFALFALAWAASAGFGLLGTLLLERSVLGRFLLGEDVTLAHAPSTESTP